MKPYFYSILKRANLGRLCQVKRRLKDVGSITGFVVAFSDSLVLFHVLATDTFQFNGYIVLREEDVSGYRFFTKASHWQFRAAKHLKLKPVCPAGISLASFPELVRSIDAHYPLITFHPEARDPKICYIGRLVSMTERTLAIDDLDCNCEWSGPRRIKISDVTRVDFGGGYEQALAATAPNRVRIRLSR